MVRYIVCFYKKLGRFITMYMFIVCGALGTHLDKNIPEGGLIINGSHTLKSVDKLNLLYHIIIILMYDIFYINI